MLSRFSLVQDLKIISVAIASVTQVGDSKIVNGLTRALAVQRETEIYYDNEGDLSIYPVFTKPIPLPPLEDEGVFQTINLTPYIKVPRIEIIGLASSSVTHIGNTGNVYMESRVKHIRQVLEDHE